MNTTNLNNIETLTGSNSNYKKWKRGLELTPGLLDIDMAIREEAPEKPEEYAIAEEKAYFAKWERANRIVTLIMLRSMLPAVKGGIPLSNNAKVFLESISLKFKESEKAEMGFLIYKLTGMKYEGDESVRTHFLNMIGIEMNLRNYGEYIDDGMLVYLALSSRPNDFKQIKSNYVAERNYGHWMS
ncbi:hypothetical protein CerSpe_224650 [Prunus speciosa]